MNDFIQYLYSGTNPTPPIDFFCSFLDGKWDEKGSDESMDMVSLAESTGQSTGSLFQQESFTSEDSLLVRKSDRDSLRILRGAKRSRTTVNLLPTSVSIPASIHLLCLE